MPDFSYSRSAAFRNLKAPAEANDEGEDVGMSQASQVPAQEEALQQHLPDGDGPVVVIACDVTLADSRHAQDHKMTMGCEHEQQHNSEDSNDQDTEIAEQELRRLRRRLSSRSGASSHASSLANSPSSSQKSLPPGLSPLSSQTVVPQKVADAFPESRVNARKSVS
jgi:hypothetical protein